VALARQVVGYPLRFDKVTLTDYDDAGAGLPKTVSCRNADTSGTAQDDCNFP
jgi:hypothetical protein